MRRMFLGIYLVLLAVAGLLICQIRGGSSFWFIAAIVLLVVSAYCVIDGYFS